MSDQTTADLIAEAREGIRLAVANGWAREGDAPTLAMRLAEALDAADQRAAELAAVVEKVREYLVAIQNSPGLGETGHHQRWIREALSIAAAPADLLQAHDALVWDEGSETGFTHGMSYQAGNNSAMNYRNPYRKEQS